MFLPPRFLLRGVKKKSISFFFAAAFFAVVFFAAAFFAVTFFVAAFFVAGFFAAAFFAAGLVLDSIVLLYNAFCQRIDIKHHLPDCACGAGCNISFAG